MTQQSTDGCAQGASVVVLGPDAGAGGAFEGGCGGLELGPKGGWGQEGEAAEGLAESVDVGLGCGIGAAMWMWSSAWRTAT